jgi:ABC-type glutathione transport system ATPase component
MNITVETPILDSPRVQQVRGMFDLPAEKTSRLSWNVQLPLEERCWQVGLVVGPSGCGKTTIARRLFPACFALPLQERVSREPHQSVLDLFPCGMPIKDIVQLLSAVGFASPPAWLRPMDVLSTGQQFRVTLALLLAWTPPGVHGPGRIHQRRRSHGRADRQRGIGQDRAAARPAVRRRHLS